ncbi:hypothetical protein H7U18_18345 [Klebsiella pneumoniae]|uniref:Uncharacterized protein n=1 Tax=Klebsiella pneumoniae TaxID=573 RepID=A0A923EPY7_KLEPN|nr:hypothetical protein [Klebsiella pneumoniae]
MSKGGLLKYFTVDQVVEALKTGSATLYQIRQNQYVAASRGYTEREALLKPQLNFSTNGKRTTKIMNIRFSPDTHKLLIARANREDKPAAALVNELITAILKQEELNEKRTTISGN